MLHTLIADAVSHWVKRTRDDCRRFTEHADPDKFQPWRLGRKSGWVRSNFSCKSFLNITQPDLDPRIKRRFAVGNYVFRIQKHIIQTLKRKRPHLSNNYPSVFKIGWKKCIAALIVAVYLFIITNNPKNMLFLTDPCVEESCSTSIKSMVFYDAIDQTGET